MSVKNGARKLIYDTGFRNIKKELVKKYGNSVAEQIWQKAGTNLEELSRRYEHLPKAVKLHTDGNMFRNAAVYMAIKEYDPEYALSILDEGVKKEGARVAKLLSILLHIPGMKVVMLRVFSRMLTSFFGEDAQFKSIRHCNSDMEISFDIIQCPYCKYLKEIGCPELVHMSCNIDEYIYGNLPGLEFKRTGTLGTGADKCDFWLRRIR